MQSVVAPLDNPDFVIQPFHQIQRHLVLRLAVGRYSVPAPVYHPGELLIWRKAPLFQRCPPVVEEPPRHKKAEALRVKRIVRQPVKLLLLHLAALSAPYAPDFSR